MKQGKINLETPIQINNKKISELTYDTGEITAALFAEADVKKKQAAGIKNVSISPAVEFDFGLHLFIGFAAVIAVNPEYDFSDLERIKGRDIIDLMKVGRNFLLKSEEDSRQSNSENESENTVKPLEQE